MRLKIWLAYSILYFSSQTNVAIGQVSNASKLTPVITFLLADSQEATKAFFQAPTEARVGKDYLLRLNRERSISLDTEFCTIDEQPQTSSAKLIRNSTEEYKINLDVKGRYVFSCRLGELSDEFEIEAIVDIPLDMAMVETSNGVGSLSFRTGIVENQSWISSFELDEADLLDLIDQTMFTPVAFDEDYGLLVQYDFNDPNSLAGLESLKLTEGVNRVFNRPFIGNNVITDNAVPSGWRESDFTNGKGNWHLERINAVQAWDMSIGSFIQTIGVYDSAFSTNHQDIIIPTNYSYLKAQEGASIESRAHGTAVASIIGGTGDRGGVVGVNLNAKMIAMSSLGDDKVKGIKSTAALMQRRSTPMRTVNISQQFASKPYTRYVDITDGDELSAFVNHADAIHAQVRNIFGSNVLNNSLMVVGAGNGQQVYPEGQNDFQDGVFIIDPPVTIHGLPGRLDNAAIHYAEGRLSPLENVITVGAMTIDGILTGYSAYGPAVDIAAPSNMNSAWYPGGDKYLTPGSESSLCSPQVFCINNPYGTNDTRDSKRAFDGTSAAAPVVSGVASLMFALDPTLTATEAKEILINYNGGFVTQRHLGVREDSPLESLGLDQIPILDAEAALAEVKKRLEGKSYKVIPRIEDASSRDIAIEVLSENGVAVLRGGTITLQGSNDRQNWSNIDGRSISPSQTEIDVVFKSLPFAFNHYRVITNIAVRSSIDNISRNVVALRDLPYVTHAININTQANAAAIDFYLDFEYLDSRDSDKNFDISYFRQTSSSILAEPGRYRVEISGTNYRTKREVVGIEGADNSESTFNLSPDPITDKAWLEGTVLDSNGGVVCRGNMYALDENLNIVSGSSVVDDGSGSFLITDINIDNSMSVAVLRFVAAGYTTTEIGYTLFPISQGINFRSVTLTPDGSPKDSCTSGQ